VAQASGPGQFGAPLVEITARGGLTRTVPMAGVDRHWLLRDFVEQYRAWRGG
jgi:hypothetical protein